MSRQLLLVVVLGALCALAPPASGFQQREVVRLPDDIPLPGNAWLITRAAIVHETGDERKAVWFYGKAGTPERDEIPEEYRDSIAMVHGSNQPLNYDPESGRIYSYYPELKLVLAESGDFKIAEEPFDPEVYVYMLELAEAQEAEAEQEQLASCNQHRPACNSAPSCCSKQHHGHCSCEKQENEAVYVSLPSLPPRYSPPRYDYPPPTQVVYVDDGPRSSFNLDLGFWWGDGYGYGSHRRGYSHGHRGYSRPNYHHGGRHHGGRHHGHYQSRDRGQPPQRNDLRTRYGDRHHASRGHGGSRMRDTAPQRRSSMHSGSRSRGAMSRGGGSRMNSGARSGRSGARPARR